MLAIKPHPLKRKQALFPKLIVPANNAKRGTQPADLSVQVRVWRHRGGFRGVITLSRVSNESNLRVTLPRVHRRP